MLFPPCFILFALLLIPASLAYLHIQTGTALSFGAMDVAVFIV